MAQQGESQRAAGGAEREESALAQELGSIDPAELVRTAAEFARENPHTAMAGALAIGFLLGGGLTPRILASIAFFAGRRYVAEATRAALEGAVRQTLEGAVAG